jgi:hypothetical protein
VTATQTHQPDLLTQVGRIRPIIEEHAAVQTARYESTGKVMFGLPTDWFPFNL